MNKEIKLGIMYNEGEGPDFGTIQQQVSNPNNLYLLARDIPKLNGMLTRATSAAYLPEGQSFNFYTGALAYVVDYKTAGSGKIYMYHRGKDHWYEFNIRSDLGLVELMWNRHERILRETKTISGTPPLTFESNGRPLKNYRIYGNTVNGESMGDLVTEGEHAGEYLVPLSINQNNINLYLPKTLRKFGNNSDYIDYSKQKMHRIKTNLFDGTFIHRSVIGAVVGDDDPNRRSIVVDISSLANGDKITFSREMGVGSTFQMYQVNSPLKGGALLNSNVFSGNSETLLATITLDNIANYHYLMIFLNGATNPITDEELLASKIMINVGDTALPYEAYNAATEISINLPKLSTFSGVNTLSIDSNVPPSKIDAKGIIKSII